MGDARDRDVGGLLDAVDGDGDVELVGLFDNELRCLFASVDVSSRTDMFRTGVAWHGTDTFPMVQLLWPDRNGWLPHESGFDASVRAAQPVIGRVGGAD